MNVLITGESTYIGKKIIEKLLLTEHRIIILSPDVGNVQKIYGDKVVAIHWESYLTAPFLSGLEIHSVIHLAGASLKASRWTNNYRKEIYNSRVDSTRSLINALSDLEELPTTFVTSCVDINPYQSSLSDGVFLEKVYSDWRAVLDQDIDPSIRIVTMKPSLVLCKESNWMQLIIKLLNWTMGTHWGSGKQSLSWIHVEDLANMYITAMEDSHFKGDLPASSPYSVTNREFMNTLSTTLGRKTFVGVPSFYLKKRLGAMSPLLMSDNRVDPKEFVDRRFLYMYPTLEMAIKEVLSTDAN